jgi:uncharacterized protein with ACT and thioredoxin-like domain
LLLLEILKAKKNQNGEQHEGHQAAKITAAVAAPAAAGALRFQIRVFKLGQSELPVVGEELLSSMVTVCAGWARLRAARNQGLRG